MSPPCGGGVAQPARAAASAATATRRREDPNVVMDSDWTRKKAARRRLFQVSCFLQRPGGRFENQKLWRMPRSKPELAKFVLPVAGISFAASGSEALIARPEP